MKIGIAWYREDQWNLLKSTATDPECMEDTYQEWLEYVGKSMKELKKEGYKPVKVNFDVDKFNAWCKSNGKAPNSESRSEYVTRLLRAMDVYNPN